MMCRVMSVTWRTTPSSELVRNSAFTSPRQTSVPVAGSSTNTTIETSRTDISGGSSDAGRRGIAPGVSTWFGEGAPMRCWSDSTKRRMPDAW